MSAQMTKLQFRVRSFLAALGLLIISSPQVLAGGVEITNFGHSSLLIKGAGRSILLNPFKAVGCATGLKEPKLKVDVILASSELADEGAKVAKGVFLVNPGSYRIRNMQIEGFTVPHDRLGGRRFGFGTIWQWEQAGLNFAHLGGVAAPLGVEEKILLGRPDVLVIAVGGGDKVYNYKEAAQIVRELNPRRVIPVQYSTKQSPLDCNLNGVKPFLDLMPEAKIIESGKISNLSKNNSNKLIINLFE